jgi:hypothetical protein
LSIRTRLHPLVLSGFKIGRASLLIDRDRMASLSRLTGTQRQARFILFRDGKIVRYRGILDSFNAAEQMMGHPIALPDMPRVFEDGERIAV